MQKALKNVKSRVVVDGQTVNNLWFADDINIRVCRIPKNRSESEFQ